MNWQHVRNLFPLFYVAFLGALCLFAVQVYYRLGVDPLIWIVYMGIIFGIYTFNRFTDMAEDSTNKTGSVIYFQNKPYFLVISIACLAASIGILAFIHKLHWAYFVIVAVGVSYSMPVIPWYSRKHGMKFIRIKELIFFKNLAVALLWGGTILFVPMIYASGNLHFGFTVALTGTGLCLLCLNNTIYGDMMDAPGDSVAGIRTLPTAFGVRATASALLVLDFVWIFFVNLLPFFHKIDIPYFMFLSFFGWFPFLYLWLHTTPRIPKAWAFAVAETDLIFFAVGLLLLHRMTA